MDPTKAQKLKQRTRVGATLVVALAALLWCASLRGGTHFVAGVALALTWVSCREARQMGLPWRAGSLLLLAACALLSHGVWLLLWDPGWWPETQRLATESRYGLACAATFLLPVILYGLVRPFLGGGDAETHNAAEPASPRASARWLALIWLCAPLAFLYPVRFFGGVGALVALVILSKVGDIAGYYVGSLIGKTKPFPKLSPGKTTAGCVGSFVTGTLAGVACQAGGLLPDGVQAVLPGLWAGALAGASINLASQAGDLYESFWKRKTAVKDSGTWFGPSGGMLDLVDSLLFSAPLAALTWPLLFRWLDGWVPIG